MIPAYTERLECLKSLYGWMEQQRDWQIKARMGTGGDPQTAFDIVHLWRPASRPDAPTWVISAGIHGDEPSGTVALSEALLHNRLSETVNWSVWPVLNPYGFLRDQREDAAGIDLNRDFKKCRSKEVCFFIREMEQLGATPNLHLSLHEDWEYAHGYLYEINSSDRPSLAGPLLTAIAATTGRLDLPEIDGHVPTSPGYIFHATEPDLPFGWPEAIYMVKRFPLRSYTLEAPGKAPFAQRMAMMRRGIMSLLPS